MRMAKGRRLKAEKARFYRKKRLPFIPSFMDSYNFLCGEMAEWPKAPAC